MIVLTDVRLYLLLLMTMFLLECSKTEEIELKQSDDKECKIDMLEYCKVDTVPGPTKWPSNVEELEKFCFWALNRKNCHLSYTMRCLPWAVGNVAMWSDSCEIPSLYEVVKKNAACLSASYYEHKNGNTSCKNLVSDFKEEYDKFNHSSKFSNYFPELPELRNRYIYAVLKRLLDLGCYLNNLQCPEAEDYILEMVTRQQYYSQETLDEDKDNAFAILEFLNFQDEYKKLIKDTAAKFEKKCAQTNCLETVNQYIHLLENFSWSNVKPT